MENTSSKQKPVAHKKICARSIQKVSQKKRLENILRYREKVLGKKISPELKKAYLLKMYQNA